MLCGINTPSSIGNGRSYRKKEEGKGGGKRKEVGRGERGGERARGDIGDVSSKGLGIHVVLHARSLSKGTNDTFVMMLECREKKERMEDIGRLSLHAPFLKPAYYRT